MSENENKYINGKQEIVPSMENFKAAMVFIVLTIATSFISDVLTSDTLTKCNAKEFGCKALNTAANILPTLFGTIAIFLLELCVATDILRLRGMVRSIVYTLILISLPFVYIFIDGFIKSINLFI